MTIFGKTIHFHRWEPIYVKENYEFRKMKCTRDIESEYRYCVNCDTIQEYNYDFRGGWWCDVSDCEKKILLADIVFMKKENGVDHAHFLVDPYLRQGRNTE
jgi:hypothetical protein